MFRSYLPFNNWGGAMPKKPEDNFLNVKIFFRNRDKEQRSYEKFHNEKKDLDNLYPEVVKTSIWKNFHQRKVHPFHKYYATTEAYMMSSLIVQTRVPSVLDKFKPDKGFKELLTDLQMVFNICQGLVDPVQDSWKAARCLGQHNKMVDRQHQCRTSMVQTEQQLYSALKTHHT